MYREKLSVKKENPIAALYPSAKGWMVLLYFACVAVAATAEINGYAVYLVLLFGAVPVLFAVSGVGKNFLKVFKSILMFIGLIFIVQILVLRGSTVAFRLGFLSVYKDGLQHAIVLCFVILNIAGILLWLFQTTEIWEITYALEQKGMSSKAAFVFLSTFQMIEVLGKSSKTIMNAQRARGIETEGNLKVRSKAFFPMIVPLVVSSIMNTEERLLTLESKGFDAPCRKTNFLTLEKSGNESKAVAVSVAVAATVFVGRILLWVL